MLATVIVARVRYDELQTDCRGAPLAVIDPSLSNRDLAPTTPAQRTWTMYNYIALWFSMSMEITTYQLASSLIAKGMDWKQAVGTVLLGNLIVLVPMLLNAHAGAKYGIPFPVFIRAPFGVRGANLPAILRAVVACGWFGIQSWIGGTAIHSMLAVIWPAIAQALPECCGPASSASGSSTWSWSGAASNPFATCKPSVRPSCSSWPRPC